ncbi:MAG: Hsp20/alpha crystallin family protein [Desulfovibrio sp.]|nr:Hsp20/alpha crystallin family protein [Desulfovibrio sp.]
MKTNERFPRLFDECPTPRPLRSPDLWDELFSPRFPMNFVDSKTVNASACLPKIDLTSDEHTYTLQAELPGLTKDDVHLEIEDGCLTLHGERHESSHSKEDGYELHERHFGSFTRKLTLPEDALIDKITASQKDGLLTIAIPRESKPAQRIPVQSA